MERRNPEFEAALATVLEDSPTAGEHVAPERLVAYHHDRLAPEEADAVREHLAACRSCADLVLELARFGGEEETGEDGLVDFEEEADWRALRSRIAQAVPEENVRATPRPRPLYLAYGLAASLLLSVGLGAWVAMLEGELRALREPQVNLAVVNLYPEEFSRGDADEGIFRGDGERFVVTLTPSSFPAAVEHRVEILDAEGHPVWSGGGLQRTEAGSFHLELSRRLLEPGQYRIHLLEGDERVAEFDLQVAP